MGTPPSRASGRGSSFLLSEGAEALKVFRMLTPQLRGNLQALFFAGLLFWCSIASLLPTLPLYVDHLGGTKQQIGLVMGAFALGLLPSRAWLGPLADRRGRKIVLRLGAAVVAIAPLGYLVLEPFPEPIWQLCIVRAFHGISIAAFTTAYSALVTDLSPPRNRGELLGYMNLVNPIGVAIGPAMGGFLQESVGYSPLFLMSFALGILSVLLISGVSEPVIDSDMPPHPERVSSQRSPNSVEKEPFWQLLFGPRIRIPALVMLLTGLVFGTLSTFVPLFIKDTGVNLNAGLFYTAAAICSFGIRLLTGRASDRYGRGLFITGSLVLYTVAMLLLWRADSPRAFLLAAAIEGAASGTLIPMVVVLMSDRCGPRERGRFFSLCIGGFDLGLALAGPILGFLAELVGYRNMFAIAAGLAFTALAVFATLSSKDLPHSLRFAIGRERDIYALDQS